MEPSTLIAGAVGAFFVWRLSQIFIGKVSPTTARALVEGGARLVDVRSPGEHASGHIPGSTNIPVGDLAGRAEELGDKARPVVVYCASGVRSASAARILKRAGFTSVHDLGSIARWG